MRRVNFPRTRPVSKRSDNITANNNTTSSTKHRFMPLLNVWELLAVISAVAQLCARYVALPWLVRWRERTRGAPSSLLVVTAHPDDETLFFAPALDNTHDRAHVLCLSDGGFDGLGKTREREMAKAAQMLGISAEVVNHSDLPDSPTQRWPCAAVGNAVCRAKKSMHDTVDAVLTFDDGGVTQHPNHVDTARGVLRAADRLRVPVFALCTVPWWNRFAGPFSALLVSAPRWHARAPSWRTARIGERVLCVSADCGVRASQCMRGAHRSQLTWFRELYLLTSCYLYVCTFVRVA